ncbi:hypothetical protein DAPPUDRAFT_61331 [Daphnia pulex]|uniref:Metallo-beta-lactamase domain-containing protein 1 n=1 Tax=Daphnia pulex TaxID=6669 RepID=E9HCX3_DAPPU|nr:hypothetical protein DAPPUDRAFT_61331 [Daphnia pulex]|eukprot:EFX70447.1 hypothetical protein DAPPUDRAFT_61331 [Daphnia pulex]
MANPNRVKVLHTGYSSTIIEEKDENLPFVRANCSCVLVTGSKNIIVDTMTPWDTNLILLSLEANGLTPDDINYVISTHGHSDHTGNNNLFLKAKHIVGYCISVKDKYFLHPFDKGLPFEIGEGITVIPTPGHTADDVSVVIKTEDMGTVVIAGDIFEREEDIEQPEIWRSCGSVNPEQQENSRALIANFADYIVPGHGPIFKVTDAMKKKLSENLSSCNQ